VTSRPSSGSAGAPRLYLPGPLAAGSASLGETASRHAQVLRLQPGDALTLFDGRGGEWRARLHAMGRREASAQVLEHLAVERELPTAVTLALAMPAGDRMDWLVEKATELGVAAIQPLTSERSVLRLSGERAAKRRAHWHSIAIAACEQCGRNRVPEVAVPVALAEWLASPGARTGERRLLAWREAGQWSRVGTGPLVLLSGPEGGFTPAEEDAARAQGFVPTTLGARVLRADTAPLAALASVALQ
jgi:16S rRNA (uracil1498-N3)-methyltransferase